MAATVAEFTITAERTGGYVFRTRFDKEQYAELRMDEPSPLGTDSAPNAARILAAAVGNCLSASLLFCLTKSGVEVKSLTAQVKTELVRNENRRLRIGSLEVTLRPELAEGAALGHCLDDFEDFCMVTQSVREGLDVRVRVEEPRKLDEPSAQVLRQITGSRGGGKEI